MLYPRKGNVNIIREEDGEFSAEDARMSELNKCRRRLKKLYNDIAAIAVEILALQGLSAHGEEGGEVVLAVKPIDPETPRLVLNLSSGTVWPQATAEEKTQDRSCRSGQWSM